MMVVHDVLLQTYDTLGICPIPLPMKSEYMNPVRVFLSVQDAFYVLQLMPYK